MTCVAIRIARDMADVRVVAVASFTAEYVREVKNAQALLTQYPRIRKVGLDCDCRLYDADVVPALWAALAEQVALRCADVPDSGRWPRSALLWLGYDSVRLTATFCGVRLKTPAVPYFTFMNLVEDTCPT